MPPFFCACIPVVILGARATVCSRFVEHMLAQALS